MTKLTTRNIALISVFAALIAMLTRLPGIPILGGAGQIQLSVILYPIIGIVLGPWMGLAAALIGNFVSWIIPKSTIFGLLTIPAGAIAAFVSGCLSHGLVKMNWRAAAIVLAMLNAFWYLTPVGLEAPFYPVLHITALALILLYRNKISEYIRSPIRNKTVFGVALCSYIAVMADHMFGNLVYASSIGLVIPLKAVRDAINALGVISVKLGFSVPTGSLGDLFMLVLPISAVERITCTAIATFIGVAFIRIIGLGYAYQPSKKVSLKKA